MAQRLGCLPGYQPPVPGFVMVVGIKIEIVSRVDKGVFVVLLCVDCLCVQLVEDFISLPAGEVRAEKFGFEMRIPGGTVTLVAILNLTLLCKS
jgi:hypothetical protein